ncbi:MarR family winged helix-turn-helix transcriptional regulator [Metabacillus sp. B2-18]|uniref:MarR family winged helix-turn-helix transcriptional regulator n=1 Tax=Metabacillus sp. B2-18 TaxID=2897333 RepID=UPI001E33D88E|nr:MarR family transcriptional regulator [Metabacillus sp. B2-18]UGB28813.1 MarR family transcriptional regulator [Metabacillus sp. B2-18]
MERKCSNHPFLLLMQTARLFQEQIRDDISQKNLSITEFSVLEVLFHKGKQTIQQIAKSILIASSSMTYVIDKLEQKDLIKRNACPEDRRVVHITLTKKGLELMDIIMPEHEELVDKVFESLNPNEVEDLSFLLRKVRQRLEK